MILIFTLMSALAFGGQHKSEPIGDSISKIAESYLQNRPRLTMEACNGLVQDILADAGVKMKGRVDNLWEQTRAKGWTHQRKNPRPGDLVFWHKTYDRNRNGRVDDRFTHIGVVIRVDKNNTIHMVHRGSRGISPVRMNLHQPDSYRVEDEVYNDYLAARGYGKKDQRLSGQLFAGFATIRNSASTLANHSKRVELSPPQSIIVKTPRPSAAPATPSDSPTLRESWNQLDARFRKRLLEGKGIRARPLRDLNCKQIWAVRNAIFARHGYAFKTDAASAYFQAQEWYQQDLEVNKKTAAGYLTSMDYENLEMIVRIEKRRCHR